MNVGGAAGAAHAALGAPQLVLDQPGPSVVSVLNTLWGMFDIVKPIVMFGLGSACALAALMCAGYVVMGLLGGDPDALIEDWRTDRAERARSEELQQERRARRREPWAYDRDGNRKRYDRHQGTWWGDDE